MTEEELIELIQGHLPEELTGGQIDELRQAMKTSPRLRDALLEELTLEQSLAAHYAPPCDRIDEIVAQIVAKAAARRRSRWRTRGIGFGLLILAGVAGVYAATHLASRPAKPEAQVAANGPAATRPATTRPAGQTSRPTGPAIAAAGGAGQATTQPAARTPAGEQTPDVPTQTAGSSDVPVAGPDAGPTWRTFEVPERVSGLALGVQMGRLFTNGPQVNGSPNERNVHLRGRWQLAKPLLGGRMLRLAFEDPRSVGLEAWRGERGVEFRLDGEGLLRASLLTRVAGHAVRHEAGRDGRWDVFRRGAIDLRYQDGNMVLARGDVVLAMLPIGQAPEKVFLDADCRLALLDNLPCNPLALPASRPVPLTQSPRPASLVWTTDRLGKATLRRRDDGSVEFSAGQMDSDAETVAPIPYRVGGQVEFKLVGATHHAGFLYRTQESRRGANYQRVNHKDTGVLVTDPGNTNHREEQLARGLAVDGDFWVRLSMGIDQVRLEFSVDGEHWGLLQQTTLDEGAPLGPTVTIGLSLPRQQEQCRIALTDLRLRRLDRLTILADEGLVGRVPDTAETRRLRSLDEAQRMLAPQRPQDATEWAWRMACDAALVRRAAWVGLTREAAKDLVQTAIAHLDAFQTPAVAAALEQLADLLATDFNRDTNRWFARTCDDLAEQSFALGRGEGLTALADGWMNGILASGRRHWEERTILPERLLRLAIYDLYSRRQWESLAAFAGRYVFLCRQADGNIQDNTDRPGTPLRLAQWAHTEARSFCRRGGDEAPVWNGDWSHPLTVQTDRETMNTIAEFIASVDAKAYDHAVKVLSTQMLPDGILPTGADGQLYQAIHVRIRQLIGGNPDLAALVVQRLAPIGAIRLQRALREGDVPCLQALAVQFLGTPASRDALFCLADRDLSMGNVLGAAEKYKRLQDTVDAPRRALCAAKYRLACALAGQLGGEPVTAPVELPSGTISPADFERMIQSLLRSRQTGQTAMVVAPEPPPAPRAAEAGELEELTSLQSDERDRHNSLVRYTGWALAGRELAMHPRGRAMVMNLDNRQILWNHSHSPKDDSEAFAPPSAPLIAGSRLYVRQRGRESELACFERHTGKKLWSQGYDEGVLSDPILANGWLYVLTYRTTLAGQADVYLRRVSPETGQSALAARLVALRRDRRMLCPGALTLAGDRLLFASAASLVCCDLVGEGQWIRRLTYVPPDVDRALLEDLQPGPIVVRGNRVIFAARDCPAVQCVDLKTGRAVWSSLQPQLRRFVGLVGKTVVLVAGDRLQGLDAETGKGLWLADAPPDADAVIPAEADRLLCLRLDKASRDAKPDGSAVRRAWWVSAGDGRTIGQIDLFDTRTNETIYEPTRLYSTGKEIIGLAAFDQGKGWARVFRLRLK